MFLITVPTIDWSALCWLEGDFRLLATVRTDDFVHCPRRNNALSPPCKGLQEPMVQERPQDEADQDLLRETISRSFCETNNRVQEGRVCGRQVSKEAWSG